MKPRYCQHCGAGPIGGTKSKRFCDACRWTRGNHRGGPQSIYPWDEWIAAGSVTLKRGVDFRCSLLSLRESGRRYAASRGYLVSTYTPRHQCATCGSPKASKNEIQLTFIPRLRRAA